MRAPLALFIGSWHEPNVVAARKILKLATQLPDVNFAIVGSVGLPLRAVALPPNVELFGVVSDDFKQSLLATLSEAKRLEAVVGYLEAVLPGLRRAAKARWN